MYFEWQDLWVLMKQICIECYYYQTIQKLQEDPTTGEVYLKLVIWFEVLMASSLSF